MSNPGAVQRFAFPAMIVGSASLAFGPWMVRLADVGPLASGFWRMIIAAPLLLLLCPLARQPLPRLNFKAIWFVAIAGAAFAFDLGSWHSGIVRTTLANATLFANTTSFAFAGWGFLVARSLPSRVASIALALAFCGTLLLLGRSYQVNPRHLTGDILCLLAAFFYTVYLIAIGHLRGLLAPLPTLALATVSGAAVAFVIALTLDGDIWPHDWSPLIGLALSSQIFGQGLVVYAVAHLEPLVAGLCLLIQPVISATIGWIVYGEHLGPMEFAGALMIAAALVLVRMPHRTGFPSQPDKLSATQD